MIKRGHVLELPQASERKCSMKHYTGLDASVKETGICIVDEMGKICCEVKVTSHPDDLKAVLQDTMIGKRSNGRGSVRLVHRYIFHKVR